MLPALANEKSFQTNISKKPAQENASWGSCSHAQSLCRPKYGSSDAYSTRKNWDATHKNMWHRLIGQLHLQQRFRIRMKYVMELKATIASHGPFSSFVSFLENLVSMSEKRLLGSLKDGCSLPGVLLKALGNDKGPSTPYSLNLPYFLH